ncbi:MAG: type II secretion system F family protein [Candidatus Margulisiibacteriota bacterium]
MSKQKFFYRARDRFGKVVTGRIEAENSRDTALELGKMGLAPLEIESTDGSDVGSQISRFFSGLQKVGTQDLIVFTRQLASILEAGVPLLDGLNAISEQIMNKKFKTAVMQVKNDIESGSSFSGAMEKHPLVFSTLIVSMVRAGEKAGILPQVLDRISNLMDKDFETSEKIKAATRYPIIVTATLGIALLVLSVFVIPRFSTFFSSFKVDLPLPTRILQGISYSVEHFGIFILLGMIAVGVGFTKFLSTDYGRTKWDKLMISTPIFGPLFTKIYFSRYGRMLSSMLAAGIPIIDALNITAGTITNKIIAGKVLEVRDKIPQGSGLAEAMRAVGGFPPIANSMVTIGEKAGTLENMLDKMADYFDRESDYIVKNLTPLIEPIMIFGLALIMLLFALGIFMPMWDVVKVIK